MSEDDIDSLGVEIVKLIENWPKGWADNDSLYQAFTNLLYEELERFCTRERNYN
jgi:hypothetical protein